MSLNNLVGKTLERIIPDYANINRILNAAKRNIADSKIKQTSAENRFDAAYKAIMQLANVALQASGFRTLTSVPGHHQTMIQSLAKTVGIEKDTIVILDKMRKQRNVADYSGDVIPESTMKECIRQAESLMKKVNNWLSENHPELIAK
jgi:uncharacterized protein (UPF0332 family)